MQRIAIVICVLFIVWRVLSAYGKRLRREGAGADDFSRFSARRRDRLRRMRSMEKERTLIACSVCGTYVPMDRVVNGEEGQVFCGEECRLRSLAREA
jgi:hypothetical protein